MLVLKRVQGSLARVEYKQEGGDSQQTRGCLEALETISEVTKPSWNTLALIVESANSATHVAGRG